MHPQRLSVIDDSSAFDPVFEPFRRLCKEERLISQEEIDEIAVIVAQKIAKLHIYIKRSAILLLCEINNPTGRCLNIRQACDHFTHQIGVALGFKGTCLATDGQVQKPETANRFHHVENPNGPPLIARGNNFAINEAFEAFLALEDKPDCFPMVAAYDPEDIRRTALVEKMEMITLQEYGKSEGNIEESVLLQLFLDYLEGAIHLAENGLILCDICTPNIGIRLDGDRPRGIFHDIEGLRKVGWNMHERPTNINAATPPETFNCHSERVPIKVEEMIYQLGSCLNVFIISPKCLRSPIDTLRKELLKLANKMTIPLPEWRMGLSQCKETLEKLLRDHTTGSSKPAQLLSAQIFA